jgi:membrane protease YdiL (CAAX protease family)
VTLGVGVHGQPVERALGGQDGASGDRIPLVLSILPAALLFGWARFVSGSVWPAAIAHAAWNSVIQGAFDPSTKGHGSAHTTNAWVGESGILVAAASVLVVAWLLRRPFPVLGAPGASSEGTLSLRRA